MNDATLALEIRGLSKTFGAQRALRDFPLAVRRGEVHALIGENGSGKSTLVKCLSGYHDRDEGGQVIVGAKELPSTYGPQQATDLGLSFVHQDLGLIPTLTVAANLFLGESGDTAFGWRIRTRHEIEAAKLLLARLGRSDIDPRAYVRELSPASRAVVAVARCLRKAEDASVVVLDEPTAPLSAHEVDHLLDAIRRVARGGHGVLYISHRLDEVFALADRVTVLRDGEWVATVDVAETSRDELVELMLGRSLVATEYDTTKEQGGDVVMKVEGLTGPRMRDASFTLHRGEVVGVAGLQGCGKSELGRMLFGDQQAVAGVISLSGKSISLRTPADAVRNGIAMVPANRHRDGVHLDQSIADNVTLLDLRRFFRRGVVRDRLRLRSADRVIAEYDVQPADPKRLISQLSGGNQQKAVLGKWMHRSPKVLILDEPAQAMDVGAKANVYSLIQRAAREGMAVLVISDEFDDLARLADRVLVVTDGRIVANLSGSGKTAEHIADMVYRKSVPA